jgi:hypothetical protein
LQKVLYWFGDDAWREDYHQFRFILDGKQPGKMAAGERYLSDAILPALSSRAGATLGVPEWWNREPVHPFVAKFDRPRGRIRGADVEGVVDLRAIFERGLEFVPSHEHAGLQLVDCVTYVVRRAVLRQEDRHTQRAFDLIRPKLRNEHGHSLRINKLRVGVENRSSLHRYRGVYGSRRAA